MFEQEITPPAGAADPARLSDPDPRDLSSRSYPVWLAVIAAALVAGTTAWIGGEVMYERFQPDESVSSQRFAFAALNPQLSAAGAKNAAVAFGLLGGALGSCLGIAGGSVRRSTRGALTAGLAGLVVGGALGVAASFGLMPIYFLRKDPSGTDLSQALLYHGGLWGGLGLAGGMAFGLGWYGARPRLLLTAATGGLVGALVGTFVFEVIGAVGFPFDRTAEPISATASTRLLARLAVTLSTAVAVLLTIKSPRRARDRVVKVPSTQTR